jgi:hypothetical protein
MRAYRYPLPDCEVSELLFGHRDSADETHHIRGGNVRRLPQANIAANFVAVSSKAHDWGHTRHPYLFETVCWYAKFQKHNRKLFLRGDPDWNPSAIDVICDGGGLIGRISGKLLPLCRTFSDRFETYCVKLITELEKA